MTVSPTIDKMHHPEWLGAWIDGQRVAFPTPAIHAVFSTQQEGSVDTAIMPLDVHVHAGVPVFVMPLSHWLPEPRQTEPTSDAHEASTDAAAAWIVAFQPDPADAPGNSPCVGCRVQGIRGPFRASEHAGYVEFDGVRWPTWTPQQPS